MNIKISFIFQGYIPIYFFYMIILNNPMIIFYQKYLFTQQQ